MTTEKKLEYAKNALDCLDSTQLDLIVNMIRTMKPKLYDYRIINRFVPFDGGYYPIHTLPSSSSYSLTDNDHIIGIMVDYVRAIDHSHGSSIVTPPMIRINGNRWLSLISDTQCFVDEGYYVDKRSVPVLEQIDRLTEKPFYMVAVPTGVYHNGEEGLVISHIISISMVHDTDKQKNSMLSATATRTRHTEYGVRPDPIDDARSLRFPNGLELKDISISLLIRSPRNVRLLDDPREWD